MADYKWDKYSSDRAALIKKYPDARITPYIDKMKGETWDSDQGKVSKEYGDILDKFNEPDAGAGRGFVNPPRAKTDSEKEAMQAAQDAKARKKISDRGYAKGGKVKGWGQARGARAAKIV